MISVVRQLQYEPTKTFEKGWLGSKEVGYYGRRNGLDKPWVDDYITDGIKEENLFARGCSADLIDTTSGRLTRFAQQLISAERGEVDWPKTR